jgi:hypothetical protein
MEGQMSTKTPDQAAPDPDEWVMGYYLNPRPDEVPLTDPTSHSYWPRLGLLVELFARHSDRLAEWLHGWAAYSEGDQKFLFEAVWLSGSSEAQAFLRTVGAQRLEELFGQDLAATQPPDRDGIPISHPRVLDFCWTRFFVSGDAKPVRRIIGCLPLLYATPEFPGGEMDAGPMLIGWSAQWSLEANARQHSKVLEICQAEQIARSGATRQLLEAIVRRVEGAGPHAQLSNETTHESTPSQAAPAKDVLRELSLERQFLNSIIGGWPTRISNDREALMIRERLDRAVSLAEELVQTDSAAPGPRVLLADLLRMGHNIDVPGAAEASQQLLTDVLRTDPHDAEAHYTLAGLYVCVKPEVAPLAEKHFLEAERFAGQQVNPDTYQGLGLACVYQKKVAEAISYFEKYLRLVGDVPRIRELVNHLRAGREGKIIFMPLEKPEAIRRWWQFWK